VSSGGTIARNPDPLFTLTLASAPVKNSMRPETTLSFPKTIPAVPLLALLLLVCCCCAPAAAQQPTPPKRSLKTPPTIGKPTEVALGFYVLNMGKIDQTNETFDLAGLVTTTWKDERLKFSPSELGEDVVRYTADQIWVPELTIVNAANLQRRTLVELFAKPDGTVKCVEFVAVTVSGDLHLQKFPFDGQTAYIIWEPLSSEVQPLKLVESPTANGVGKDDYVSLSEWEILATEFNISERKADKEEVTFPRATFFMKIKRNSGFYIFKVFFPLLLITVISWTAFWINPNTAFVPQMNVGITSILAAITFNITVTGSLPRVPYTTLMDGYIATCYLFFFGSILSTVYIHYLITHQKADKAMSLIRNFRWIFPLAFVAVQGLSILWFALKA
jgi:hypothetical protein